ncbi:Methyl-accepting chemotaxis protein I (serine chemoreceptor protein) [hydrothermal vent metagenome]|uniref:Methyl-accepting chemotaxis protein I (Serine chemoreceptor protein) n=1 Tax=hydrothermal vent metagenome TaxID=652676 RepID=A0A3B1B1D2_9ZZZZ
MKIKLNIGFLDVYIRRKLEYLSIRKKLYFGFSAILSFMTVVVIVTVIGLLLVLNNIRAIIDEHEPTVIASVKLDTNIKEASGSLGLFLLSKEELHRTNYEDVLTDVEVTLNELKQLEPIQKDNMSLKLVNSIEQDIIKFKSFEGKFYKLAEHTAENFPSVMYASNEMNPISIDLLNSISNMILTEKDEEATPQRKKLLMAMDSLRYSWQNLMNSVRALMADRAAVSENNVRLFQEKTGKDIEIIKKLSNQSGSGFAFDQVDDFENILELRDRFFVNFEKFIKIHKGEQWRQDSYLMRTEVGPLLRSIDKKLKSLEKSAQSKINDANDFLVAEVIGIIIIALVLLLAGFVAARSISTQIVESVVVPLNSAVDATGRIAAGDLTVVIDETSEDEIGQLVSSLNMMSVNLASLVSNVKKSGIQVTSSSTEIAATAKQQEATVTEQAATANQIATAATEISATVQELVQTMDEVTGVTETTAHAAADSQTALGTMKQTMHNMMDATAGIGSKLSVLSEKASNINSVVTTITKVADQTNLLSLNAAIEAEKAGEYGVGFVVVATEIRRLADQTAVATWDIEQMVKEMQSAVSAGVMGMDKFTDEVRLGVEDVREVGTQLANIIEQVQALLPRFEEVHIGMQNQAKGAQQINESIAQLSDGTHQSAESLRQSTSSINVLHNAANSLQEGVSKFKLKDNTYSAKQR